MCGGLVVTSLHRGEWALVPLDGLLAAAALLIRRSDLLAYLALAVALLAAIEAVF